MAPHATESGDFEVGLQEQPSQYILFPHVAEDATRDGKPVLNRHSTILTRDHDFPGAKVRWNSNTEAIILVNRCLGHAVRCWCT